MVDHEPKGVAPGGALASASCAARGASLFGRHCCSAVNDYRADAMTEPQRDLPAGYQQQLDQGYTFGSVMTFAQRPLLTSPNNSTRGSPTSPSSARPSTSAPPIGPGARFGPRALRGNAYESGTYHLELRAGDLRPRRGRRLRRRALSPRNGQQSLDNIKARVHEIASRRIIPFTMGGDHTITWPAATAVADVYGYGNVGMVHFDAHADTADTIDGNLASHGTPMRRLIDSGAIPGRNFIQIGLRSYWPPQDVWEWMAEQGMRWHLMDEIWERGFQAVMVDAVQEALDGPELLYISIDIDSLDPAYAPPRARPSPAASWPPI